MFKKRVIPLKSVIKINKIKPDGSIEEVDGIVHHLEFGTPTVDTVVESTPAIWRNPLYRDKPGEPLYPAKKVQFECRVTVFKMSLEDLKKNDTEKITSFTEKQTIYALLDLTASSQWPGELVLKPRKGICLLFSGFRFLSSEEAAKFTNIEDMCIDIPIGSLMKSMAKDPALEPVVKGLTGMIGDSPEIINAAVGYQIRGDVEYIAIRLEVRGGDPLSIDSWKRFFDSDIALDIGTSLEEIAKTDWSIFVDKTTLLTVFNGIVHDQLKRFKFLAKSVYCWSLCCIISLAILPTFISRPTNRLRIPTLSKIFVSTTKLEGSGT